jgi:TIR domain/SIR2-like domain
MAIPNGSSNAPGEHAVAADHQEEDDLWGFLLDYIEQGTVVPVVGRDLLVVDMPNPQGGTTRTSLYSLIATELAEALRIEVDAATLEGPNPLGTVASEFIVHGGDTNLIYRKVHAVVQAINARRAGALPEVLQQLTSIDPFRVFLTTTFDPLLAECVGAVRRAVPSVRSYAPGASNELVEFSVGRDSGSSVEVLKRLPAPVIVHILGKVSSTPNYVVTEEDAFEFVYSLQDTRRLEGLFDLLAQMKLLIVGCRFPSWLVCFFLRTVRRARLLQSSRDRTDFVVDSAAAADASLIQFLRTFKTHTEIFTGYTPTEFVGELARRWGARARAGGDSTTESFAPGSIFLSYANEDAVTATRVAEQLAAARLPVWFDRQSLASGDEWERKIRRNIEGAAAFVPILSRSCVTERGRREREFRREWRHAIRVKEGLQQNDTFICPLSIDDLPRDHEAIDLELRGIHWDALGQDGALSTSFTDRLRRAFRNAQQHGLR